MDNRIEEIKVNSFRAWVLAARPKTLIGASVPIILGFAYILKDNSFIGLRQILPLLLCFIFAFIMQIDANFINDYYDCLKGNDKAEYRLGPLRACSQGWITLPMMKTAIKVTTCVAIIFGLPLIWYGGLEMVIVGILCLLFAFLYTTKLSYLGLGDLLVLIFFGIVPVTLTYYLSSPIGFQVITFEVFITSISCGLVIDTLLVVNNYRDRDNDLKDNKRTLIVFLGEKGGEYLYLYLGVFAVVMQEVLFMCSDSFYKFFSMLLVLPYLVLHISAYRKMKYINHGRKLNMILSITARNIFIYGLLTAASILFLKL